MLARHKFITNSSSTSLVAFGVCLDDSEFEKLEEAVNPWPKEISTDYTPWDTVYVHIGFPRIGIDKDGNLMFPKKDSMKKAYKILRSMLDKHGIDQEIGYIEEGWYNG